MPVLVALLRGINVGGKNMLPMKSLCAIFGAAGCTGVSNYIQSGNIIFSAPSSLAAKIPKLVSARIEKDFGFKVPVITRTHDELVEIVRKNPFAKSGADFDKLLVMFLAEEPSKAQVASLDPNRSPPDEAVVRGREIYLRAPTGFGRSKLTNAYFDSKLSTVSTARNWRTTLKLLELTKAAFT